MMALAPDALDAAKALKDFEAQLNGSGAVASFIGYVRPKGHYGPIETLFLQAYSPMTEDNINAAIARAKTKWPLDAVSIIHRTGHIKPHDAIVFVACASAHRRAALESVDYLMDYLKTQAIFWKKEITDKGGAWIEPRGEDYQDYDRWKDKD